MPYDPGISYQGGQLFAQGIGQFGQGITRGLDEWRKLQQDAAKANALYTYAKANNLVTPEEELQFAQGSLRDKVGLGEGWATTMAMDQAARLKQAELENAIKVAQIHAAATVEAYGGRQMSPEDFASAQQAADQSGYIALPTGDRRGVQYVRKPFDVSSAQSQIIPGDPSQNIPAERMLVDKYGNVAPSTQFQRPPAPNAMTMFGNLFGPQPGAPGAPTAAGGMTPGVQTVTTQADYDALPPGSLYIGPDGQQRQKPMQ